MTKNPQMNPLVVVAIGDELRKLKDMGVEKYLNQWNELDKEYEQCIAELRTKERDHK